MKGNGETNEKEHNNNHDYNKGKKKHGNEIPKGYEFQSRRTDLQRSEKHGESNQHLNVRCNEDNHRQLFRHLPIRVAIGQQNHQ